MNGRRIHRSTTIALSALMTLIGLALAGEAIVGQGGILSPRMLAAVLFVAAGLGRIYVERRRGAPRR
ncbi:MAG TPA: hypothetical protein VMS02_05050 [Solirubrobacteraceae bacterium]|nr:hypothetical protein [Solirubrobacteraceae bacterium]